MTVLPPIQEPSEFNANYIFYWNHAGLELNRLTHSIGGPQGGPTLSSRALGILHLAIHDAYFALRSPSPYATFLNPTATIPAYKLPDPLSLTESDDNLANAVAGAAVTVLEAFYARRNVPSSFSFSVADQLDQLIKKLVNEYSTNTGRTIDALSAAYQFGMDVGTAILDLLAIKPGEPGADQGQYRPKNGRFYFRDEPSNPVRLMPINPNEPDGPKRAARIYHAPFYGMTAKRFAVQMEIGGSAVEHIVADPPKDDATATTDEKAEYIAALREVHALGGAPTLNSTLRSADQTVAAYYWAYDGANLIGTPPRLYNQIIRTVAWNNTKSGATDEEKNDEFVRLFALVNTAMADAGIFCWREKYCFEFWRPLPGVREHDTSSGPGPSDQEGNENLDDFSDPFWQTLGAPETNTDKVSFKPPFPAYPSGHATFGAASFQIARLYYKDRDGLAFEDGKPDNIPFDFVSEELNGVSRDLRQPYDPKQPITEQSGVVRTRVVRRFKNLWAAIVENAASRVWLGVHWRFDAFPAKDVIKNTKPNGVTVYKDSDKIEFKTRGKRKDRPDSKDDYPIGGAPLGIEIANDIFQGGLQPTPPDKQPIGRNKCGLNDLIEDLPENTCPEDVQYPATVAPKASQTNIR